MLQRDHFAQSPQRRLRYGELCVDFPGRYRRIAVITAEFGMAHGGAVYPGMFALEAAAPNPFRGSTTIAFRLPAERQTDVSVYDVSGRLVRTLLRGTLPAGQGEAVWDGRDEAGQPAASGVYFVRLRTDGQARTRPLVRLR